MSVTASDVQIELCHPKADVPMYGSDGAAGFDLRGLEVDESLEDLSYDFMSHVNGTVTIYPQGQVALRTGIKMTVPPGQVLKAYPRSGNGSRGIVLANTVGVIDSDYRGEIRVILFNRTKKAIDIKLGDRHCQAVLEPYFKANFQLVGKLEETSRGEGGFGSTGNAAT